MWPTGRDRAAEGQPTGENPPPMSPFLDSYSFSIYITTEWNGDLPMSVISHSNDMRILIRILIIIAY